MSSTVRRSSRSRKVVDYARLLNQVDEISDDQDDSPITPSAKKIKWKYDEDCYLDKTFDPEGVFYKLVKNTPPASEESCQEGMENKRKVKAEMMTWDNEMSDYEKTIMKNIEERNKFMAAMGFPEAVKDLQSTLPVKVYQEKPKIKRPRTSTPKEILPLREPSRRLRNLTAANAQCIKAEVNEEIEKENQVAEVDDRLLDTMKMEEGLKVEVNCDVSYNPDLDLSACDIVQFRDQLTSMKFLKFVKMNPGRIQCLHVHSSFPNPIIFSGDKYGNFSIWRPNHTKNEDAEEDVIKHQPHRAGLNCISTSIQDKSILYSTGYDGTIVQIDLNKGQFTNIFATDFDDRISHITWHDEFQSRKFLVAHGRGDVGILDSAAGKTVQKWIDCFPRSVKTVQHHPTQSHYFVASSGTGNVKIFDMRNPAECITEEKHQKSVTSAFFSPDGNSVLTNSHDDHIRVFDSSVISHTLKKTASYVHSNFTGRWLTPFKAVWVPRRSDVFHIGSMLNNPRRMRFYKANSDGLLMDLIDDNVSTICSVISMHPSLPVVAGANSSGKVYLFGPPDLFSHNSN